MGKILTTDHLATIRDWVIGLVNGKASLNNDVAFSSVTIGNIKLTENNGKLVISNADGSGGSASIIPNETGNWDVVCDGQTASVTLPNLIVDKFTVVDDNNNVWYYTLDKSSAMAKMYSSSTTDNGGAGTILTSRYEAREIIEDNILLSQSRHVSPNVYTRFNLGSFLSQDPVGLAITLDGFNSGFSTEYWIEINYMERLSELTFYDGANIHWVGGEPDWTNFPTPTALIHIINKIATVSEVPVVPGTSEND